MQDIEEVDEINEEQEANNDMSIRGSRLKIGCSTLRDYEKIRERVMPNVMEFHLTYSIKKK